MVGRFPAAGPYGGYDDQDFEDDCRRSIGASDGGGCHPAGDPGGRSVAWRWLPRRRLARRRLGGPWRLAWGLLARRLLLRRLVGSGNRRGCADRRGYRQRPLLGWWVWRRLLAGSADL